MLITSKLPRNFILICTLLLSFSCSSDDVKQLREDWFYNSGIDSASEFRAFFDELQSDLKADNVSGVADKVHYPISIRLNGSLVGISGQDEFKEKYSNIFTSDFKQSILDQKFEEIGRFTEGASIANGGLWVSGVKNTAEEEYKLKIFAINPK